MEIMVTGRKFQFEEAKDMSLVHDIYDSMSLDEFRQDVLDYAGQFSLPFAAAKAIGNIKGVCKVDGFLWSTILHWKENSNQIYSSQKTQRPG